MQLSPDQVTTAAALLVGSEVLSLIPSKYVKANGWVQLILAAARGIAAGRK